MTKEESARKFVDKVARGELCITQESTHRAYSLLTGSRIAFDKMFEAQAKAYGGCPSVFEIIDKAIAKNIGGNFQHDDERYWLALWDARNFFLGLFLPLYDYAEECWAFRDRSVARALIEKFSEAPLLERDKLSDELIGILKEKLGDYGEYIDQANESICEGIDDRIISIVDIALIILYNSVDAWPCKKDDIQLEVDNIGKEENKAEGA